MTRWGLGHRLLVVGALVLTGLAIVAIQMDMPIGEMLTRVPVDSSTHLLSPAQVTRFAEDLSSHDPSRRRAAAVALRDGESSSAPAVPELRRGLGSPDEKLRLLCIQALGAIGPAAQSAGPDLARVVVEGAVVHGAEFAFYRAERAAKALHAIHADDQTLADLTEKILRGSSSPGRWLSPSLLSEIPSAGELRQLLRLMRDPDELVRTKAIQVISCIAGKGCPSETATPDLVAALRDPDSGVIAAAAAALSSTPHSPAAITALIGCLSSPYVGVRLEAARTLEHVGREAVSALPALRARFVDTESQVRTQAAAAFAAAGGERGVAAHVIAVELRAHPDHHDWSAIEALGHLKTASPEVLDVLTDIAQTAGETGPFDRAQALEALGKLGASSPRALEVIARALRDRDDGVRWQAVNAAIALGDAAAPIKAALDRAAQHDAVIKNAMAFARQSSTTGASSTLATTP